MIFSLVRVVHVDGDINDLPVIRAVGCPLTVLDAMPENDACASCATKRDGVQGAVCEICDCMLSVHEDTAG
jgi:3-deoxy-D-manno-octulosonate 8-phosphate phosphatase (KDO 8-P phosphatase)